VLPILLGIKQGVNKNREKNREGDFNRMREVKLSGDTANCETGEDSGDRGLRGEGVELIRETGGAGFQEFVQR